MGEGEAGISPAEQDILVWAMLCVFVSFLGGDVKALQNVHFSMKWLFRASATAIRPKVEFCLRLSWDPYREAIFPRFRKMKLLNRFS